MSRYFRNYLGGYSENDYAGVWKPQDVFFKQKEGSWEDPYVNKVVCYVVPKNSQIVDISPNNLQIIKYGNPTVVENSMFFNGASSIEIRPFFYPNIDFTIEIKYKTIVNNILQYPFVYGRQSIFNSKVNVGIALSIDTQNILTLFGHDIGQVQFFYQSEFFVTQYVSLALVKKENMFSVYNNKILVSQGIIPTINFSLNYVFNIGRRSDEGNADARAYFQGNINYIKVTQSARTPQYLL